MNTNTKAARKMRVAYREGYADQKAGRAIQRRAQSYRSGYADAKRGLPASW